MSSRTPTVASTQAAADPADDVPITPVGVDVGTKQLVAVATADAHLSDAVVVDGERARRVFGAFQAATHRLQERAHSAESLGDVVWRYWRRVRREFRTAAEAVLTVVDKHPRPVVVLEDLPHDRPDPLVACRCGNARASTWFPTVTQAVVADHVVDAGVPVAYVNPKHTTQQCHRSDLLACVEDSTIVCTTEDCPVGEVDRDRSAAVSIVKRTLD